MNFLNYFLPLLSGIYVTLILMLSSLFIGFCFALLLLLGSLYGVWFVKKIIDAFTFFIRGTPLLVQIFLIYYGTGQFEWIRTSFLWTILKEPFGCAIIALSINTACYTSVLLKGAVFSVPKSEIEACKALGMSTWQSFCRIIFPRAFRIAMPAYSNEVLMILKGTSLASTITLLDIMGVTQQLISQTYEPIKWYIVAGIIYLILNAAISRLLRILSKRKNLFSLTQINESASEL